MGIDLNNGEPRLAHNDGTDCGCMLVPDDGNDTETDGGDETDGDNGGSGDAGNVDAGAGGDPAPAGENGETTEEEKKPEEGAEDTGEGTEGGATVLLSAATAIAAMLAF